MGVRGKRRRLRMKEHAKRRKVEVAGLLDMPRPFLLGRRSCKDGVEWYCDVCHTKNYPSHHLFVHLPAFRCSNLTCRADAKRVDFRFSFGNLLANGIRPIGEVYRQEDNDCLIFSIAKACEITVAVVRLLLGSHASVPRFNPFSLRKNYVEAQMAAGMEKNEIGLYDEEAELGMLELLETVGIEEIEGQEEKRIYRIKSERIDADFETVAKALADGYPLVVDFAVGDNFADLTYDRVYKAPYNNEGPLPDLLITHAVVLVGAARYGDMDFYYFLNSYGEEFCVVVKDGRKFGGIGKIRANDILQKPHIFLRKSIQPEDESTLVWDG